MKWVIAILMAVFTPSLFGQTDTTHIPTDSASVSEPAIPPGFQTSRIDTVTKYESTKSPGLATLFSALVPGTGQLYNESYWKIPVVLGFGVWFGSQWLHYNRLYKQKRDEYAASLKVFPGGDGNLLDFREFYRDQRDTYTWYLLILYLVNVADAYVDASLYDFNVGDDLSIRLMPEAGTRVTLRVSF
jgi:hypothetical protein